MPEYDDIVEEVAGLKPGEFQELSRQYSEFLEESRDRYGAAMMGLGPVETPFEVPEGLYEFDIGMMAGVIRSAMEDSEDGREFIDYLENDIREESEHFDTAARTVVEQAFPEIL